MRLWPLKRRKPRWRYNLSGVLKGVAKVFRKVVKVAIKVAPYALAAAAIVFTGGAAIGALPTFGAAIGSLGLSAGVTSAITAAGLGAAVGGLGSVATGGKFGKGALLGMAAGGALGLAAPAMVAGATGITAAAPAAASVAGAGAAGAAAGGATVLPAIEALGPIAAPAAAGGGGILGGGGLLSSAMGAQAITGVGQAIAGASAAKGQVKAEQAMVDKKNAQTAANYGVKGGLLANATGYKPAGSVVDAPTPTQKYDPMTFGGSWQYDAAAQKIVFVPSAGA